MNMLVGYTGFVGSNIYAKGKIDRAFNSKNIAQAYGASPDLLIYAGLRAEKYLANNAPEKDMQLICEAEENIKGIDPKKIVLISTVDVFKDPVNVDETSEIYCDGLHPYGLNRYRLECWVRDNYHDAVIVRLPALFGINIKKNFIYDFINIIPFMLKSSKFDELTAIDPDIRQYYQGQGNDFYRVKDLSDDDRRVLKEKFKNIGFSALNFTDSRSIYQFYPLSRLWDDIQIALDNGIPLWHPATEPVSAGEIYEYLTGDKFVNELPGEPAKYDYRTKYDNLYGGANGYICGKQDILREIDTFVKSSN
ncbi:MAG: NAD(P)-dependent oxidoreductase [Oscillospiraceae bacterium]|nr:NAD(P)-dependent oxidoreductase [Oscillospiraceae bacterium]